MGWSVMRSLYLRYEVLEARYISTSAIDFNALWREKGADWGLVSITCTSYCYILGNPSAITALSSAEWACLIVKKSVP